MSTEVESSQLVSGLTAASSSGAEQQNKSEGTHLQKEQEEHGQNGSEKQLADGLNSEATKSSMDTHKKCKENDKENDQSSNADSAVEAVKRKVVEAPPPKVNPWTKRTTGRVPINNINSSSQEKGEMVVNYCSLQQIVAIKLYNKVPAQLLAPPAAAASEHVGAAFWQLYCREIRIHRHHTGLSHLIWAFLEFEWSA